ncbi:WD40 repeat domain-containing protein [Fimbriiglobus ruber]|uniref:WD40 repeat domain-containing protein n=1 Tax=Fimbriiglobus ruber TaxID=1908690 RepID=UPI00137B0A9B|nr:WD40 repeat domain-containing protein [Fimbriiglobus ruber]
MTEELRQGLELSSWDKTWKRPDEAWIHAIAFSADGETLYVGDAEGRVRLMNTSTGTTTAVVPLHSAQISAIAVHPTQGFVSGDPKGNLKHIFTDNGQAMCREVNLGHEIDHLSFSNDGNHVGVSLRYSVGLFACWDGSFRNLESPADIYGQNPKDCLAFSPDDRFLAAGTNTFVHLWVLDSGREVCRVGIGGVRYVAFVDKGNRLLIGTSRQWYLMDVNALYLDESARAEALANSVCHHDIPEFTSPIPVLREEWEVGRARYRFQLSNEQQSRFALEASPTHPLNLALLSTGTACEIAYLPHGWRVPHPSLPVWAVCRGAAIELVTVEDTLGNSTRK